MLGKLKEMLADGVLGMPGTLGFLGFLGRDSPFSGPYALIFGAVTLFDGLNSGMPEPTRVRILGYVSREYRWGFG